jgi:hypothetical protein
MSVCKSIFALPALLIFVISCTDQTETQQNRFLASYSDYCGYAYKGATNFVDLASGDLFEEAELTMVVTATMRMRSASPLLWMKTAHEPGLSNGRLRGST